MINPKFTWLVSVPEMVSEQAWRYRDIRPSDAKVILQKAIETYNRELRYKPSWPTCKTHWNHGLDKWLYFTNTLGCYKCWATLVCNECHPSGQLIVSGCEYMPLSEVEKFAGGKI